MKEANNILSKFDYPSLLIKEYKYWYLLLRFDQCTFGAMVMIEKNFFKAYSNLSINSFNEQLEIIKDIEIKVKEFLNFEKINYLTLMMVDSEVHVHVIPRYKKQIMYNNVFFDDHFWGGPPNLEIVNNINIQTKIKLVNDLKIILGN